MLKYLKLSMRFNLNIGISMDYGEKTNMRLPAVRLRCVLPVLLMLILSACSTNPAHVVDFKPPAPATTPAVAACQSDRFAAVLRHSGVVVTQVGDMTQLDLLSDQIFMARTANVKPTFYPMVSKLNHYISCFKVRDMKVSAYESPILSASKTQALTSSRAQRLANALVDHGLTVRMVTSAGSGDRGAVALNRTWHGRLANNRVTIRFWRVSPRVGLL